MRLIIAEASILPSFTFSYLRYTERSYVTKNLLTAPLNVLGEIYLFNKMEFFCC